MGIWRQQYILLILSYILRYNPGSIEFVLSNCLFQWLLNTVTTLQLSPLYSSKPHHSKGSLACTTLIPSPSSAPNSSCKWTHRARVFHCLLLLLHRFVCLATSFYLTMNSVPFYTYTTLFYDQLAFYCGDILPLLICFSIVRCMLRYHFLAMMSHASMNATVHLLFVETRLCSFECIAIRTIGS